MVVKIHDLLARVAELQAENLKLKQANRNQFDEIEKLRFGISVQSEQLLRDKP